MNPLISVLVPCYNGESTVINTIREITNEFTGIPFEIVFINDGSTDNSEKLIRQEMSSNSHIRLFNKENGGLSDARNFGLKYARGEYIWFFDADDLLFEGSVKKLYDIINDKSPDILCFASVTVDYKTKNYINELNNSDSFSYLFEGIYKDYLKNNKCNTFAWQYIYRRTLIQQHNLQFDTELYGCEDGYWNILVAKNCPHCKFILVDLNVVKYMVYPNSITNTTNQKKNREALEAYLKLHAKTLDLISQKNDCLQKTLEPYLIMTIEKSITRFLSCRCSLRENKYLISRIDSIIDENVGGSKLVKVFMLVKCSPIISSIAQILYRNIFLKCIKPRLGRN